MTKFMKAKPQQARLKIGIYGPAGSGKTFTALLMAEGLAKVRGKRIAFVDTERGTDFYAQKVADRQVHPEAFDFDAIYTRSIADVTEAVRSLGPEHGIVVLDSVTHLWEAAMDAYTGKRTRIDSIPMSAWGRIKKPYKSLINWLIGSPLDVFILGRQKNVFEQDEGGGEMKKIGVAMRAEGETPYEPHVNMRMEWDLAQKANLIHVEKDRTGVLAGKTIAFPNFKTIEPLLPLLGTVQAPAEDEDERMAKDGDLLDQAEAARAKAKEEKSAKLMTELQGQLMGAPSNAVLATVAAEIQKASKYLLEEHAGVLRELYKTKRDGLMQGV